MVKPVTFPTDPSEEDAIHLPISALYRFLSKKRRGFQYGQMDLLEQADKRYRSMGN